MMNTLPGPKELQLVLEAAARVDDGVGGHVQATEDGGRILRSVVHCGLTPAYFKHYRVLEATPLTTCGQASHERRRAAIRDVREDVGFAPHLGNALAAGYLAVQSTPMLDRRSHLVGVMTTYFAAPHFPSPASLRVLDHYAHVGGLLLELLRCTRTAAVLYPAAVEAVSAAAESAIRAIAQFAIVAPTDADPTLPRYLTMVLDALDPDGALSPA